MVTPNHQMSVPQSLARSYASLKPEPSIELCGKLMESEFVLLKNWGRNRYRNQNLAAREPVPLYPKITQTMVNLGSGIVFVF
jgi:hypothetical protein